MQRYWVIAPVESESSDLFNSVWQFDLINNLISIGWKKLSDVSKLSTQELEKAIASSYPDKPLKAQGHIANMMWKFYHEITPGDFVIARRGRKRLAAVGKVTRSAFYAPGKNPAIDHPRFLELAWQEEPRDKVFPTNVFHRHTIVELSEVEFRKFIDSTGVLPVAAEASWATEDPQAFVLEEYLEDFIVSNFETIFKGELKIYEDAEGNTGQQYDTDIGPIDILAVEPKSRAFVVIELKKGRPSDQVIGQILRYMGWVKKNLSTEGQAVKGLVICRDRDLKLSYALGMTHNIDVRYYSMSFKLREVP
jgi:restriction system protein